MSRHGSLLDSNAEELDVRIMETSKTKLRPDHPDTLTSIANLALTRYSSGHITATFRLLRDSAQRRA